MKRSRNHDASKDNKDVRLTMEEAIKILDGKYQELLEFQKEQNAALQYEI